jgi:hypothetical protein
MQNHRCFAVEAHLAKDKAILLTVPTVQVRHAIEPKPVLEEQNSDEEYESQICRHRSQVHARISRRVLFDHFEPLGAAQRHEERVCRTRINQILEQLCPASDYDA